VQTKFNRHPLGQRLVQAQTIFHFGETEKNNVQEFPG
jgi:hypothetical protein